MNRRTVLLAGTAAAAVGAWRLTEQRLGLPGGATRSMRADATPAGSPRAAPALGINLTPINYWTAVAFIDRLKASSPWDTYGVPAPLDARGYPTGLGGQRMINAMIPCEEGTYVLMHDGDMDTRVQGGTLVSRRRGQSTYEVRGAMPLGRALIIDAIRKPPSFMHFIHQRHSEVFAKGEIFTPEFLEQLRGFDTLRFMDWMRTNGSKVVDAFPPADACSYAAGVPLEIMLALASKVGAHPWLCVPHLASDALIGTILREAPKHGASPYIEYSNEMWNLGFEQARYAQQQAATKWGAGTSGAVFYGYRAGQIARLAQGSECRMVIGAQTMVPARADAVWDGVRRSGATDRDFNGWIIATYVTGTLTDQRGPTLAMAARNDVAGAVNNMIGESGPGAMSVATMSPIYAEQGRIAADHGLKLIAYEGNMHLNPIPAFAAQKDVVKPFFEAVVKSPLAAKVTEANLDAFGAAGGSLACLYNLSSGVSDGGVFGLVDSGSWSAIRQHLSHSPEAAAQ